MMENYIEEQFKKLPIDMQVTYINSKLEHGASGASLQKELKVNLFNMFARFGYKRVNNQYILVDPEKFKKANAEEQEPPQEPPQEPEKVSNAIVSKKAKSEPRGKQAVKIGRPSTRDKSKQTRLTIEIDKEVSTALKYYLISTGGYANGFIEDLLKKNIPGKYFKY